MILPTETRSPASDAIATQFQAALAQQRQGRMVEAEALYRQVLLFDPRHAGALHLLGMIALQRGDAERACGLITQSIEASPLRAEAHADLGGALQKLGRPAVALASYEQALRIKPGLVAALYNRATALQELDRPSEALESYDTVIALQPQLAPAHHGRGTALVSLKRFEEALRSFDRALELGPDHIEALSNRGGTLQELGRPIEAIASLDHALRLDPRAIKALNNRGNALRTLNRQDEALLCFDRAIELDPAFFEAHRNRGGALRELRQSEAALVSLDAALKLRPNSADVLRDRAETLTDLKRYSEAAECLDELFKVDPEVEYAQGLRVHLQRLECNWSLLTSRADELIEAINAGRRAHYPFSFISVSDSAATQLRCARTFVLDKFPPTEAPLWRGERYGHDKIRIAYVSGDLRYHVVSCLLAGVLEKHDRSRFEIIGISFQPEDASPMGQRVRAAFDRFVDVSRQSDRDVASLMRELEVDIAVDLMGFTKGCRTAVLAHRPAPVQVNYLGYPGTMGAPYIDYILADAFVVPERSRDHYSEKIAYLPDSFQANDDQREPCAPPPGRRELSLPESGLVLCCFNNNYKVNPSCFDVWMRLLSAVPDAVLWLLADSPAAETNLRRYAQDRGVDPSRLIFASRVSYAAHLSRMQCADLFLDTVPFNGGITASDALWAGVPLLTCAGEAFAARMAGSLLNAVGLPELVTGSLEEYAALALELASTPARLGELRARLARNRVTAPLFSTERFCRNLEAAYVSMWERTQRGETPETFAVKQAWTS